jgi:hypothetical protein
MLIVREERVVNLNNVTNFAMIVKNGFFSIEFYYNWYEEFKCCDSFTFESEEDMKMAFEMVLVFHASNDRICHLDRSYIEQRKEDIKRFKNE